MGNNVNINIILDTTNTNFSNGRESGLPTFAPNQTVSGHMTFSLHVQKQIDAIVIVFEEQCFTEVIRGANERED